MERELRDAKKTRGVINILTGWIQVMGQMSTMADVTIIPDSFTAFTDLLSVLNVDIVGLVSFKCLVDDWFSNPKTGSLFGFWWSMHIQIAFPIFMLLVTMLASQHRMMKCRRQCAKIRAAMNEQGADEEEIGDAEDEEYTQAQTFQLSVYAIFGRDAHSSHNPCVIRRPRLYSFVCVIVHHH